MNLEEALWIWSLGVTGFLLQKGGFDLIKLLSRGADLRAETSVLWIRYPERDPSTYEHQVS